MTKLKIKWKGLRRYVVYSGFNCGVCGKWVDHEFEVLKKYSHHWFDTWGMCEECETMLDPDEVAKTPPKEARRVIAKVVSRRRGVPTPVDEDDILVDIWVRKIINERNISNSPRY